jgi:alcohol dehydrogenase
MTTTVRAAVLETMGLPAPYAQSRPLKIREVELDPPGPGEVRVKILAAGLCHSDLSVINGDRPRPMPMLLGHESAGEVLECGAGVTDLAPGDRVALIFMPSCGGCLPCQEGRPALCEPGAANNAAGTLLGGARRIRLDGKPIHHHVGVSCFAEQCVVSRRSCVKVDADLTPAEMALFGCAVITGAGSVINSARVQAGQSVAVVGLGGVGFSALLAAVACGAREVVALDLSDKKLDLAKSLGATACVNASKPEAADEVRAITKGGVDFAFEMAGVMPAMELAWRITRRGGSTVTASLPNPNHRFAFAPVQMVAEERTLRGSFIGSCVPQRDIPRYIELYRRGKLPVDRLMGEQLTLDDINRGFDRLATGEAMRDVILF